MRLMSAGGGAVSRRRAGSVGQRRGQEDDFRTIVVTKIG